jgi:predicted nucleotide-binding protein (sugar kinase/HSP70/actin superfamily)
VVPAVRRKRSARCGGCDNRCPVTVVDFEAAGRHVTGNRCERVYHSGRRTAARPGINHLAAELDLLLRRPHRPSDRPPRQRVGLPLALGTYENLPFWASLLVRLGHEAVLSGVTDRTMVEDASHCFCSDSVCLPARIASAHLVRLGGLDVDRVLFPMVVFEAGEAETSSHFNCPIVTGYPEVVASNVPAAIRQRMPIATPPVSFRTREALRITARKALAAAAVAADGFDAAFDAAWDDYQAFLQRRRRMGREAIEQARARQRPIVLLACRPYHLDPYLNHGIPEMLAGLGYDVVSSQWLADAGGSGTHILGQWAYPNRVLQAADWTSGQPDVQLVQLNSFGCGPDAIVADEAAERLAESAKTHTLLRIDESTAPGSIRLRLRTLGVGVRSSTARTETRRASTPPFLERDRQRTIVTAPFAPLLSLALVPEFARVGYTFQVAPDTDEESLALGLKHVNNEICYPAILTVGDILKALRAHRGRRSEVAVGLTQTGGPCRASNYVPILKKAMVSAGFGDVPVVGVRIGVADPLNEQPGFTVNRRKMLTLGLQTVVVTDALAMMARALAVRERNPGEAARMAERLVREWSAMEARGFGATLDFVAYACREMSAVPVARESAVRVGIVGEIYVKHSAFANHHLADWLVAQGIEPVIPPLASYFAQEPVNATVNRAAGLDRRRVVPALARVLDAGFERFFAGLNRRLERFGYPVHFPAPRELAAKANRILSLTHQYGEGWVLGGEVMDMAEQGVTKVVCLQPFGCIANQVIARGIESRLRSAHPSLELLYIDLDHNTSAANLFNRMELLIAPPLDTRLPIAM